MTSGTIVQVGSALAYRGIPLQTAYCGAKHAIQGFHEALRCELLHEQEQRARDDGADAGGEHPAVLLGAVPIAQPRAAGAADLPARGRRPRRSCTPPTTPGGASTGSAPAPSATLAANAIAPGMLDRYSARTGFSSQQTDQPPATRSPGQPVGAGGRSGRQGLRRHGVFDDRAHARSARRSGCLTATPSSPPPRVWSARSVPSRSFGPRGDVDEWRLDRQRPPIDAGAGRGRDSLGRRAPGRRATDLALPRSSGADRGRPGRPQVLGSAPRGRRV